MEEKKKGKVISVGFENEKLEGCLKLEEITEILSNKELSDNVEKCLKTSTKLFSH